MFVIIRKESIIKNTKDVNAKGQADGISLEELLPHSGGSIFRLARMAMIRASEIHFGSAPLVEYQLLDKETTIALREISKGEVSLSRREKGRGKGPEEGGQE